MGFSIAFIFLLLIVFIFSSKKISPIPYFPSQKQDLPLIIKALNLQNNQTIFDLGAGDGIVILEAAKSAFKRKLDTKFIAVEINPILITILYLRRLFHPNKKNIRIILADMFTMTFSKLITNHQSQVTFYLYISPWFLNKTISNIKKQIKKFRVVSYMYSLKDNNSLAYVKTVKGKNSVFIYDF